MSGLLVPLQWAWLPLRIVVGWVRNPTTLQLRRAWGMIVKCRLKDVRPCWSDHQKQQLCATRPY